MSAQLDQLTAQAANVGFCNARIDAPSAPRRLARAFRAEVNSSSGKRYRRSTSSSGGAISTIYTLSHRERTTHLR